MDKSPSSHKFRTSPAANPTSPAAASSPEQPAVWARIRPADKQDVPVIHRLVCQLAGFLRFNHVFSATEFSLSSALFPTSSPPSFLSLTALLLPHPPTRPLGRKRRREEPWFRQPSRPPNRAGRADGGHGGGGVRVAEGPGAGCRRVHVRCAFPSTRRSGRSRGCTWRDCSIVREAWRRRGLGPMLLSAVAARMGLPKVEWDVVNWNAGAVGFYEGMSAVERRLWRHMGRRKVEAAGTTRACAGFDQA